MQHHIDSCNRKIDSAQRRLEKTAEEIRQTNALVGVFAATAGRAMLTTYSSKRSMNSRNP
jgi:hypothetical protein